MTGDQLLVREIKEGNTSRDRIKYLESDEHVIRIENKAVRDFIHSIVESGQLSGEDTMFVKSMYREFKLRNK